MRRKLMISVLLLVIMAFSSAYSQGIPDYYYSSNFLMGTSSAYYDGLLGFSNPANLAFLREGETRFNWSTDGDNFDTFNDWGLFIAMPHLGFGMIKRDLGAWQSRDYRISLGFGDDRYAFGMAYGWSTHSIDDLANEEIFRISSVTRPVKYLSVGLIGEFSFESKARQGIAEIGIRPLGSSMLTLFGDLAMQRKTSFSNAPWSVGAAVEPIPGINMIGRYFENETFTFGLTFNFGGASVSSQMHYNDDQEHAFTTYSLRSGGLRPSFLTPLIGKGRRYLKINLKGRIDYQGYRFWGDKPERFIEVLNNIKAAKDDPRITAIAINLSEARFTPEMGWEIRQALQDFKSAGKTIVVFVEYASDKSYHLASVADVIVMEPTSVLGLAGYSMSRTYLKGTLEKLGLEFDEWRLFKYKSAAETFSRDNMSDADREQFQAYLDDWYEVTRDEICKSRKISVAEYENILDTKTIMTSQQALDFKLVDKLGRWSDVDKIMDDAVGENVWAMGSECMLSNALPPKYWGGDPRIAVVYAIGDCAMNRGIKARWLSKEIDRVRKDRSIKAVVFRVDSPGGDGMASDVVAEALKACAKDKPVIVTQGQVAGSGGYWISMYGDKILAGPMTITGSIGVIGGWMWDKGFSDKLGMSYDKVQRGRHADIFEGVRLPIFNIKVPGRNLTKEEKEDVEKLIMTFYDEFTAKVAVGRNMSQERVKELGQGRFYSGLDGKTLDLVDEVGGLMMAIELAKKDAGIAADQRVELVETPKYVGWFPFKDAIRPVSFSKEEALMEDPGYKYIKMLLDSPYKALPMIPPGYYPTVE